MENEKAQEEKIQEKFREFYAKIQELENKAKALRADMDVKMEEHMDDLKEKNTKLYDTLQDIRFSGSAALYDMKEGLNKAADILHDAIKKASRHFQG